jgi:hypothetical protein
MEALMEPQRAMDALNIVWETRNGAVEGLIIMLRSRIRIRIKVKSLLRIRTIVMRIRAKKPANLPSDVVPGEEADEAW